MHEDLKKYGIFWKESWIEKILRLISKRLYARRIYKKICESQKEYADADS